MDPQVTPAPRILHRPSRPIPPAKQMINKEAILEEFATKAKILSADEMITLGRELDKIDAPHTMFDTLLDVANDIYGFDISTDIADAWFR